jgi:integrase
VARLRAFLRYCADRGETSRGLDHIDSPRIYRGELPPRALGWDLIEKLLASVDRSDNLGRRDHAILHLMAYYGLRASEVASLTLDAVNWKTGTLRVDQRKARSTLVLPLADQTLRILDQYLANRCPCDEANTVLFPTKGVGVKTIGDLLGHHSLESTCVYLRIETDMLRTVALDVPGGAAR